MNNFDFTSNQIDQKLNLIIINKRKNEYNINKILNFKINKQKNDSTKKNVFNIKLNESNTKLWTQNSNNIIISK